MIWGSLAVATYLIYCGRRGHKAAQVIAPSAAAFALVALAAAVVALGGLGENLTGPAATGGFAAAGAILLALAVIASEEIAVLPFLTVLMRQDCWNSRHQPVKRPSIPMLRSTAWRGRR